MQIGYLGPLEVRDGERLVDVPGRRLRTLLVRLAADAGRAVPPRTLIEALWPDEPPSDPANALQSLVSRLRRALGHPSLVEQLPAGYRLAVAPDDVDAVRFARLAAEGRSRLAAGDPAGATAVLHEALGLWRGDPLDDDDSTDAEAERARLADLRLQAVADRMEAELACAAFDGATPGTLTGLVGELEQLVAAHPLREDLAALRMRALVAAGRPAEALIAYEQARAYLADTLGSDPSPALQAQHLAVLRAQEPAPAPRRPARQTNLRATLTSFVGRDDDRTRVAGLLGGMRLVTVVGTGGAGKTRLATEVATGWLDRAGDGVWFVELAPVSDPDNVPIAVVDAVGARELTVDPLERSERARRGAADQLRDTLADAECLLVLDNCEHVIEAAADLVDDLLGSCPGVRVLATSREPLGVDGESLYPLSPLALPPAGASVAEAADSPAVRLLLDRALAAGAPLDLDDTTVGDMVEVVRRLDGLPLAIELAAARLRVMPIGEVALRLGDRFALLSGGRRTAMPRHRTLRAVVEWSWDLLTDDERAVAERFSVFGSGATAEAVAAVTRGEAGGTRESQVEQLLHALVDKSLLVPVRDGAGSRFRMLETLREYGSERLAERGELEPTLAAHAAYFARLVDEADRHLRGPDQVRWLRRLDDDRDNVLAALAWLGEHDRPHAAVAMAVGLTWYWMLRENGKDASRWLHFALDRPGADTAPLRGVAEALVVISDFSMVGEGGDRESQHDTLVRLADQLGPVSRTHPLVAVLPPLLLFFADEVEAAERLAAEVMVHGDAWTRAAMRSMRLAFAENAGDVETMRHEIEHALGEWTALGDHWGLATVLSMRGQLRTMDGDTAGAAGDYQAALAHMRELGSRAEDLLVTVRLADLRLRAGDVAGARAIAASVRSRFAEQEPTDIGDGRDLLGDIMLGGIAFETGDADELAQVRARLLRRLEHTGEPSVWQSHLSAVAYGYLGTVESLSGDLRAARGFVVQAVRHGLATRDLPIVASTAVSLAAHLSVAGRDDEAAVVLGAAARLRGSDDSTSTLIARIAGPLRERLGEAYDSLYAKGKAMDRDEALALLDRL